MDTLPLPLVACRIGLPRGLAPVVSATPARIEKELRLSRPSSLETLSVGYLDAADPAVPLRNWVETPLALTGLPLACLLSPPGLRLVSWADEGSPPELRERWLLDDVQLYHGLCVTRAGAAGGEGSPRSLLRVYVVLGRRATRAWKVGIVLVTACGPGTPDDLVVAMDHRRAGAALGGFFPGPASAAR